jgi:hypothetical protein
LLACVGALTRKHPLGAERPGTRLRSLGHAI